VRARAACNERKRSMRDYDGKTAAERVAERRARLIDAGIPMLSQTVLLRGVNDEAQTLGALMRALVECRIKPYYLHHGDLAPGTGHLRTTIAEGQALMRALHGRTSGLCQPSYVLDIPGGHGKSPIGPNYLADASYLAADCSTVEDFHGRRHRYPPPDVERHPKRREAQGATDAHPSRPARRAAP